MFINYFNLVADFSVESIINNFTAVDIDRDSFGKAVLERQYPFKPEMFVRLLKGLQDELNDDRSDLSALVVVLERLEPHLFLTA